MAFSVTANTITNRVGLLHNITVSHQVLFHLSSRRVLPLHIVSAKKLTRTGRFESKNRRGIPTTTEQDERTDMEFDREKFEVESGFDDGFVMPELPGKDPSFWEGTKFDGLGFFVQYMWAFGIVFALIACGISVVTYNEGASDFKQTPAYKESVESQEILEDSNDASNSDVFESNPTEVAPSLE